MHTKEPHERRQHAMRVAGVITGSIFVLWVATLGVRFGNTPEENAILAGQAPDVSQSAAALQVAPRTGAYLEVATTSVYTP